MKYWLVKSEPDVFSVDDLAACPDQTSVMPVTTVQWNYIISLQAT